MHHQHASRSQCVFCELADYRSSIFRCRDLKLPSTSVRAAGSTVSIESVERYTSLGERGPQHNEDLGEYEYKEARRVVRSSAQNIPGPTGEAPTLTPYRQSPRMRCIQMMVSALGPPMMEFNYSAAAELFPTLGRRRRREPFRYARFAHAAEAIRFAMEDLPRECLAGAFLEVDEQRYGSEDIRRLYQSADYPLTRRTAPL
jgi:hypothetical protein